MTKNLLWLLCCLILTLTPAPAAEPKADAKTDAKADEKPEPKAEEEKDRKEFLEFINKFKWIKGPAKGALGDVGQISIPEGFMMADAKNAQKLLESAGNPISGSELGLLAPTNVTWTVIFEFSDVGYVKDDEKDKLDADKILKSIKEGTEAGNEERKKMGAPPLHVIGWETPPKYNDKTHNLEWAVRAQSEGHEVINYNTRILGRKGVMEINLVVGPEKLAATLPDYRKILADYTYKQGETYAEYKSGDKVAQYGLAALVVGGAAIGAAKLGLFASLALALKKLWKLIILGVAAVAGWIKKMFSGRSKDNDTTS